MKLSVIAEALGCEAAPEWEHIEIERIADPQDADSSSITFIANPKYQSAVEQSAAAVVLVKRGNVLPGKVCLEVDNPDCAFARTGLLFEDGAALFDGPLHATASIHPTAKIGAAVSIGPFSVIGKHCSIGDNTVIGALCVIENHSKIGAGCRIDSGAVVRRDCTIGNRVIIQSDAVIGSEGFGNARDGEVWVRIPSFGGVVIEDDAEIGAGTTIDRGTLKPTIIGKGVKIDNLCQIAHNVVIGENTAVAAQAGFAGSMKIGKRVMVGGQAGFAGQFEVGDDAFIGAQAGVSKRVDNKAAVTGYPARDLMTMRRIEAAQQYLPEALKELKRLRKEIEDLKKNITVRE